jgi:hypothetical protein
MSMMPRINLIPSAHLLARRRRRRMRVWSVICGAYGFTLLAVTLVMKAAWTFDDQAMSDQINRTSATIQAAERSTAELRSQLAESMKQLEASRAVSVQPDWSVLLAMLSQVRGESIVLNRVSVQPLDPPPQAAAPVKAAAGKPAAAASMSAAPRRLDYRLDILGQGLTQNDVSQFALRLEETQLLSRVGLKESIRQAIGSTQGVSFRIECDLADQPHRNNR